jgi:hypothetical protein
MTSAGTAKRAAIESDALASRGLNMIAAEVGDEAVLLDIDSGYFFQLNKSATRIWNLLETPTTVSDLCARLQTSFTVDAQTCRTDVLEFVSELHDKGLIDIGDAPSAGA